MPLAQFRCPDSVEIPIKSCISRCRMLHRCVTKPTLYTILAGRREWTGQPSTTQLLNGHMMEWLKVMVPYSVGPRDMAFSLLGTIHHSKLSKVQDGRTMSEQQVSGPQSEVSGIMDLLTPDEDEESPGSYELVDYKTYGSYKVAKILGLVGRKSPHPTEVYLKTGVWGRAGTPRMVTTFHIDPTQVDRKYEELQLNHYRVRLETAGFVITRMNLQITVRDGGTITATSRGITQLMYYPVPIRRLPNQEILDFFSQRAIILVGYIDAKTRPPNPCNDEEAWDGKRCQDFCEVAGFCPRGQAELAKKAGQNP